MKIKLFVAVCLILVGQASFAGMTESEINTGPSAEVEARLPAEHPSSYYMYAIRLFSENQKDNAVFWYHAGHLRYRFHLNANPNLPGGGDPALMASLNATIGAAIKNYARNDPKMWGSQIDRVLAWDAETPNGFTSKEEYKTQWQEARSGLISLRAKIEGQFEQRIQ